MLDQYENLSMLAQCELTSQWSDEPLNKYFKDDLSQTDSEKISQIPDMSQDQYISEVEDAYKYYDEQSYHKTSPSQDNPTTSKNWYGQDFLESALSDIGYDSNVSKTPAKSVLAQEFDIFDANMFQNKVVSEPKDSKLVQISIKNDILKESIDYEAKVVYCLNRKDVVVKRYAR
jgi:hypothetical protein